MQYALRSFAVLFLHILNVRGDKICLPPDHDDVIKEAEVSDTKKYEFVQTLAEILLPGIGDIFMDWLNCGDILYGYAEDDDDEEDKVTPLPLYKIREHWHIMREKYIREVNLVPLDNTQILIPVRVGDAGPDKGRGVFATQDVKKYTLVHDTTNAAIFKDAHTWRNFVLSLPRDAACNFIEWCWVWNRPLQDESDEEDESGEKIIVHCAFDESSLLNAGDWNEISQTNVRCGSPPNKQEGEDWGPCRFHFYADRDIAAGEELLINYSDFEEDADVFSDTI